MNNYGIKTLPATGGVIGVATLTGQIWLVVGCVVLGLLIALAIRYFWRRNKGPRG